MNRSRQTVPVRVRTRWLDFSPAFHWWAARTIETVLQPFASHISSVTVRIADVENDLDSRRCVIQIVTKPSGFVSASAIGTSPFESADRAIVRGRAILQRRLGGEATGRVPLRRAA
jgi:hypothetical protein